MLIWKKLYKTFIDDNEQHCQTALFDQHFTTAKEVRTSNKNMIKELLMHGHIMSEIISLVPEKVRKHTRWTCNRI